MENQRIELLPELDWQTYCREYADQTYLPDMSLWSDKDRIAYFIQYPCTPNAKAFLESHKEDLSNEIKNVLRQLSEYELFYPCISRDQTVLHEFWERINGINFLDVFTQEELNHWHDEAIEDSFNEAVAYLNAHPEKTAAGKFFSLYPVSWQSDRTAALPNRRAGCKD